MIRSGESGCSYRADYSDDHTEYGYADLSHIESGWYSEALSGHYSLDPSVSTYEYVSAEINPDNRTQPANYAYAAAIYVDDNLLFYHNMTIRNNQDDTLLIKLYNATEENLYTKDGKEYLLITSDLVNESDAEYILDFLSNGPLTAILNE